MLRDRFLFLWRTGAQVVIGAVVAFVAARGFNIDPQIQTYVEAALFGLGVAAYAFVVHWLETRTGDSLLAKAARALARLLMVGAPPVLAYKQPVPEAVKAVRESYR